jgi:glyoxylase-like metal-dependent hydrolase (beta-lactamase superfamily II)
VADTFRVTPGIIAIDTRMGGRRTVTSAYLLEGPEPTLIETGPTTSSAAVIQGLTSLGLDGDDLAHIVVTHIHLDHAGGAGRVAQSFPKASVWVHDRGAPHLADPTKLVESAGRVYGPERLQELFGPVDPVSEERLHAIGEGDHIAVGPRRLEVLYTPGHASHHVALVDSDTGAVFAGDALGIHLPDVGVLRPATPPPDIDIEAGVASIERIRSRAETTLMFSHFGPVDELEAIHELCSLAATRLRKWGDIVREGMDETDDVARLGEILRIRTEDEFGESTDDGARDRYELLASMEMNAAGLARYWRKRAQAEAQAEPSV